MILIFTNVKETFVDTEVSFDVLVKILMKQQLF